jgi:hypothetical protein
LTINANAGAAREVHAYLTRKAQSRLDSTAVVSERQDGRWILERAGQPDRDIGENFGRAKESLQLLIAALRAQRRCFFCDSMDLTREHVWPRWIGDIFAGFRGGVGRTTREQPPGNERNEDTTYWRGTALEVMAKCACAKCNNGWMSSIEATAKPILRPLIEGTRGAGSITAEEARTIAVWITLRAMVSESQKIEDSRTFSIAERHEFRTQPDHSRVPPPNTQVWLAVPQLPGINWPTKHGVRRMLAFMQGHSAYYEDAEVWHGEFTAVLGYLAFQLAHSNGPFTPSREIFEHPEWLKRTVLVWPVEGPVRWPPDVRLNDTFAGHLVRRLLPTTEPLVATPTSPAPIDDAKLHELQREIMQTKTRPELDSITRSIWQAHGGPMNATALEQLRKAIESRRDVLARNNPR